MLMGNHECNSYCLQQVEGRLYVWNIFLTWLWGFLVKISCCRLFFPSSQEWEQIQQFTSLLFCWQLIKENFLFPFRRTLKVLWFKSSNISFPIQLEIFSRGNVDKNQATVMSILHKCKVFQRARSELKKARM